MTHRFDCACSSCQNRVLRLYRNPEANGDSLMKCPTLICAVLANAFIACVYTRNSFLPSTQAEVSSRDADIEQLKEKCKQLEAQVSLTISICDVTFMGMYWPVHSDGLER